MMEKPQQQLQDELAKAQARIAELETLVGAAEGHSRDEPDDGKTVLHALVSALPVPCALNDDHGRITFLNPAFTRTFGYDLNDIPTLEDWWPRAYPDAAYRQWVADTWQAHLEAAQRSGKPFQPMELTVRCKDDTRRIVMADASRLTNDFSGIHLVSLYDISERKQVEQELQRHRDHLEVMVKQRTAALAEVNAELESFSYSVSHDLRAPLRALDGFSQALVDDCAEQLDDMGKGYLQRISAAAQRMGKLIEDLLSLSRVTNCQLTHQDVDLSNIAKNIVGKMQEYDPQRDVNVVIAPDITGWGDSRLLEVVLDNLLCNAWKYTAKTEKTEIVYDAMSRDGKTVFYVRDNGVGFDMSYADKLFGAFQRLHSLDEFEGSGIGLATVARIVHRHGGKVWAEAAVDEGATFYFTLGEKPSADSET